MHDQPVSAPWLAGSPPTNRLPRAMPIWERRLLLAILWPLLWLQAKYVRRVTPRMPEPPGKRQGIAGEGPLIRILVAGDSGAAGVGATSQEEALCGRLVHELGRYWTLEWQLLAANGLDTPGLLRLLARASPTRYDIVVLSVGANDATRLSSPRQWVHGQNQLAAIIQEKFDPSLLVHTAVPPMHSCAALPQPLRWFMGRWACEMNNALAQRLVGQHGRTLHWHPSSTTSHGMAADGFHPCPQGYAVWARELSAHILANPTFGELAGVARA